MSKAKMIEIIPGDEPGIDAGITTVKPVYSEQDFTKILSSQTIESMTQNVKQAKPVNSKTGTMTGLFFTTVSNDRTPTHVTKVLVMSPVKMDGAKYAFANICLLDVGEQYVTFFDYAGNKMVKALLSCVLFFE